MSSEIYSRHVRNKEDPYFEVKLLITPVVVSYCFASENIPAIPDMKINKINSRIRLHLILTNSGVKVRDSCRHGNHYQLHSFAAVTPLFVEDEHF